MDLIVQISIIIAVIAFIIVGYAIIQTLKVLRAAIEDLRLTIGQVRTDVSLISEDVKEAVHNTNAMTMDVRQKLSSLNIVFAAANDIGHAIHSFTGVAKNSAAEMAATIEQQHSNNDQHDLKADQRNITSAIIDSVMSAIRIWNKVKRN